MLWLNGGSKAIAERDRMSGERRIREADVEATLTKKLETNATKDVIL